jgi:hypothetical protein
MMSGESYIELKQNKEISKKKVRHLTARHVIFEISQYFIMNHMIISRKIEKSQKKNSVNHSLDVTFCIQDKISWNTPYSN